MLQLRNDLERYRDCMGCKYLSVDGYCDYILLEKRPRGVKPGEHGGCEKKDCGQRDKKPRSMKLKEHKYDFPDRNDKRVDDEKLKTLFEEGKSDKEIAEEMGLKLKTAQKHRQSLGLVRGRQFRKGGVHDEEILRLYHEGKSNPEIAEAVGMSKDSISCACRRLGIHRKPTLEEQAIINKKRVRRIKDYVADGLSDKEIGQKLGLTDKTIQRIRKKYGIPNGKKANK